MYEITESMAEDVVIRYASPRSTLAATYHKTIRRQGLQNCCSDDDDNYY
jgi:hypothetical protein